MLNIKEIRLSEDDCPAVRTQYDMFYRLLLKTRNAKDKAAEAKGEMVIFLHPTVHTVKADISGGMMNLVLEDAEHPFVKGANKQNAGYKPARK